MHHSISSSNEEPLDDQITWQVVIVLYQIFMLRSDQFRVCNNFPIILWPGWLNSIKSQLSYEQLYQVDGCPGPWLKTILSKSRQTGREWGILLESKCCIANKASEKFQGDVRERAAHTGVELAMSVALMGRAKERRKPRVRRLNIERGAKFLLEDKGRCLKPDEAPTDAWRRRRAKGWELTTKTASIIWAYPLISLSLSLYHSHCVSMFFGYLRSVVEAERDELGRTDVTRKRRRSCCFSASARRRSEKPERYNSDFNV